jgi:hypothetical protein
MIRQFVPLNAFITFAPLITSSLDERDKAGYTYIRIHHLGPFSSIRHSRRPTHEEIPISRRGLFLREHPSFPWSGERGGGERKNRELMLTAHVVPPLETFPFVCLEPIRTPLRTRESHPRNSISGPMSKAHLPTATPATRRFSQFVQVGPPTWCETTR